MCPRSGTGPHRFSLPKRLTGSCFGDTIRRFPENITMAAAFRPLPSQEYLSSLLKYSIVTGYFYWKKDKGTHKLKDKKAGTIRPDKKSAGYVMIGIDGIIYPAHRLAWKMVTGKDPDLLIDHADGDSVNNAWHNLRQATNSQNTQNSKKTAINSTGYKGVWYIKSRNRYRSSITVDGRRRHLGYYETVEDAYRSYCLAAGRHFGEFARYD